MPVAENRCAAGPVSLPFLPHQILPAIPYLAFRHEVGIRKILVAALGMVRKNPGIASNGSHLSFRRSSTALVLTLSKPTARRPDYLQHIVQLDEAYGRQWILMMAKEKGTRKLAYAFVSQLNPERQHAAAFLEQHVKPRSQLCTDGAMIYRGIEKWWPVRHNVDIHAKWQFGKTSEIEGVFGIMRTFIRRMYHHVPSESMPEYVREFCARFSSPEIFENPIIFLKKTLILVPID
jgi:hypothetical protein